MNLLFPSLNPRLLDSHWFTADSPCDEESDVAAMEQKYQAWLASIGQRYIDILPLGKSAPEPMEEEAETDEEEGNDDSDDTEDSHDEDEEEELGAEYSPSAPNPTEATNAIATVPTNPAPHHLPINNNDIVMNDSNINI